LHPAAPTGTSTLSLHDALPISLAGHFGAVRLRGILDQHEAVLLADSPERGKVGWLAVQIDRQNGLCLRRDQLFDLPALRAICEKDRKSTRLNSSHRTISYAVFC